MTWQTLTGEEVIANIKQIMKDKEELPPYFILTDNIPKDQTLRLHGKMFEDKHPRILVHSMHKKHVRTLMRKYPKSRIETGASAKWKLPMTEVKFA